jgi:hypothetical protein
MHDTAVPTANFYRTQTTGPGKLNTMLGLDCGMIRFNNCLWATMHDVRKPEPDLQEKQELEAEAWRLVRPQSV